MARDNALEIIREVEAGPLAEAYNNLVEGDDSTLGERIVTHVRAWEPPQSLEWQQKAFLRAYSTFPMISKAASFAGCSRMQHYRWLDDPEYASAFNEAREHAKEFVEGEAIRRAIEGTMEPIYQKGELVGFIRRYSDTLHARLLQGLIPERYGNRTEIKQTGDGATVQVILSQKDYDQV